MCRESGKDAVSMTYAEEAFASTTDPIELFRLIHLAQRSRTAPEITKAPFHSKPQPGVVPDRFLRNIQAWIR